MILQFILHLLKWMIFGWKANWKQFFHGHYQYWITQDISFKKKSVLKPVKGLKHVIQALVSQ